MIPARAITGCWTHRPMTYSLVDRPASFDVVPQQPRDRVLPRSSDRTVHQCSHQAIRPSAICSIHSMRLLPLRPPPIRPPYWPPCTTDMAIRMGRTLLPPPPSNPGQIYHCPWHSRKTCRASHSAWIACCRIRRWPRIWLPRPAIQLRPIRPNCTSNACNNISITFCSIMPCKHTCNNIVRQPMLRPHTSRQHLPSSSRSYSNLWQLCRRGTAEIPVCNLNLNLNLILSYYIYIYKGLWYL